MSKPVVRYHMESLVFMGTGAPCVLQPVDHPDVRRVSNEQPVMTSPIQEIRTDGRIETNNTIYIPMEGL